MNSIQMFEVIGYLNEGKTVVCTEVFGDDTFSFGLEIYRKFKRNQGLIDVECTSNCTRNVIKYQMNLREFLDANESHAMKAEVL